MTRNLSIFALVTAIFSLLAICLNPIPLSAEDSNLFHRSKGFSERSIRGPYGFAFDGFLAVELPDGSSLSVPVGAVGHITADGKGNVPELTRTLSIGGLVILEQEAVGEYEVNSDGTGIAKFRVETNALSGELPPGVTFPAVTIETFSFVINSSNKEIQFIGRRILDESTRDPVGFGVVRGVARRQ